MKELSINGVYILSKIVSFCIFTLGIFIISTLFIPKFYTRELENVKIIKTYTDTVEVGHEQRIRTFYVFTGVDKEGNVYKFEEEEKPEIVDGKYIDCDMSLFFIMILVLAFMCILLLIFYTSIDDYTTDSDEIIDLNYTKLLWVCMKYRFFGYDKQLVDGFFEEKMEKIRNLQSCRYLYSSDKWERSNIENDLKDYYTVNKNENKNLED